MKEEESLGEDGKGEELCSTSRAGCGMEEEVREGDPAVLRLIAWAEANGAVLRGVRLKGRRFYASEDLPAGHIVFSVPLSLVMTSEVAFKDEVFGPVLQEIAEAGASDETVLALFVALERAKGEDSFWAPFLAAIPPTFNTPLWFSSMCLLSMKRTQVGDLNHSLKIYRELITIFDVCARIEDLRKEELVRIQGTKVAASLPKEHAAVEQLVKLRGGCLLSNLRTKNIDYIESAMQWHPLLWARTAVQSRGFNLLLNDKRKEVLVPLFDMLDHSPSACVAWVTDEAQGVVSFTYDAGVLPSAEIFNNYGQKANDELLLGYGFCLYPNAADVFYIRIGLASFQAAEAKPEPHERNECVTATIRQEQLWRMGVAAEYQISLKDPLPKALFFAAVLCLQPDSSAYLTTGIGWDLPLVTCLTECTATQVMVISSLRSLLLDAARRFAGGFRINDDLQMLKLTMSDREKCSLMYRLGQKEIVQAALDALESYATLTLNRCRSDHKSQGEQMRHDMDTEATITANNYGTWMAAMGVKWCGLSESSFQGGSRPAVQLTMSFTKHEVLCFVGEKTALSAELAFSTNHPLSAASSKIKGLEESVVLRLLLLYEFGRGLASPWAPFIAHLSYCMRSPICYGPELLEALNGTGLADTISDILGVLQNEYENVLEPLRHSYPHLFPDEAGTFERWKWADVVIERCGVSVAVSGEPGDVSQATYNVERRVLVLAPILSTLPTELQGAMVEVYWDKSTGLLSVHSLCGLQAGINLQIPSHELGNEACLLQIRFTSARINNRNDVMELCIGVRPEDELAEGKEELLNASGLGTVHYLTKDPEPKLLLAALAVCFIDSSDGLDDCGAPQLLAAVKDARVAARQAEESWCFRCNEDQSGDHLGDQFETSLDQDRSEARKAHALAAAAALSFVQKLQEPGRLYKAAGTLRKLISSSYKNLDGGSAEDDEKLLEEDQQPGTPGCEPAIKFEKMSLLDRTIWRGVIAYRHGQKVIMEAWMSRLKHMLDTLKEKGGRTAQGNGKYRDRAKRKR